MDIQLVGIILEYGHTHVLACAVKMSSLEEFVKNASNIGVIRRILFAAVYLPQDMPNYWQTLKLFSKAELSVSQL